MLVYGTHITVSQVFRNDTQPALQLCGEKDLSRYEFHMNPAID
jgi:hypothetical protein